jgi:hypothetical protein
MVAKLNMPGETKRSAKSRSNYFFDLSVFLGRNYSGMPIIPAADVASAARIIKLAGHTVKLICSRGKQMITPWHSPWDANQKRSVSG